MIASEPHDVGTVIITMSTPAGNVTHVYPRARAVLETRYAEPDWLDLTDTFSSRVQTSDTPVEVTLTLNPFKDEDGIYLTVHQHEKKEIPNE